MRRLCVILGILLGASASACVDNETPPAKPAEPPKRAATSTVTPSALQRVPANRPLQIDPRSATIKDLQRPVRKEPNAP
jgi:hypothetical protein